MFAMTFSVSSDNHSVTLNYRSMYFTQLTLKYKIKNESVKGFEIIDSKQLYFISINSYQEVM